MRSLPRTAKPSQKILVQSSSYARADLKTRLCAEGIETAICELCGQGELWRGRPMGPILDHINGVRDDNGLLPEIAETGYLAVGRRYGVCDNTIRKWVRQCEREQVAGAAAE